MESNWEYRPYHLVYSHSCGNALYLGDLTSALNLNFLHSQRIATVITAALGMDQLDYSQMQLTHILYPLLDAKRPSAGQTFAAFFEIVERQMREGNVLVHCSSGVSRAPTLVVSYLMKKENWTFKQAIGFVRDRGRKVMPTLGFERQLKAYEGFLRQSSPTGEERKSKAGRWRSSRMRFTQAQLPNLSVFPLPLHSTSFTPAPSALNSVFATLISRREAATHQLRSRQRMFSSDSKADTIITQSQSSEMNNFEVRRAQISQRTSNPRSLPRATLHSP